MSIPGCPLPARTIKAVATNSPSYPDSARVYMYYDDVNNPPPVPEDGSWTRFVCLSDTHSHQFPVPSGDVLLHSGDLTAKGRVEDFESTMDWLRGLPHRTKIIIAGNHDLTLHEEWYTQQGYSHHPEMQSVDAVREFVKGAAAKEARITYLQDEVYKFQAKEGGRWWSVYGCPWTPYFRGWAFNYKPEDAEQVFGPIPNVDILMTHGPPQGMHDLTKGGEHAGCPTAFKRVSQIQPRLHLFGHIHEARGHTVRQWDPEDISEVDKGKPRVTAFVNAANLPLRKGAQRRRLAGSSGLQPVIVDLRDDV